MRRLFTRLVAFGGEIVTRRRALRSELVDDPQTLVVADRFVAARLLTVDRDPATREPTIELAHEVLLRSWPTLRHWLDDDSEAFRAHRRMSDAAAVWESEGATSPTCSTAADWSTRRRRRRGSVHRG